jgi:hypothetical protein
MRAHELGRGEWPRRPPSRPQPTRVRIRAARRPRSLPRPLRANAKPLAVPDDADPRRGGQHDGPPVRSDLRPTAISPWSHSTGTATASPTASSCTSIGARRTADTTALQSRPHPRAPRNASHPPSAPIRSGGRCPDITSGNPADTRHLPPARRRSDVTRALRQRRDFRPDDRRPTRRRARRRTREGGRRGRCAGRTPRSCASGSSAGSA